MDNKVTKVPASLADQVGQVSGLSVTRNFSWNLLGNVVYGGCQWGILVVLAKLGSPEMVGRFALGLAVTAPIIMLSQLQLRGVQATDSREEYGFSHYLSLRLIATTLALLIIAGVVAFGDYPMSTALVIIAVGVSKAFESVSDVYYGLLQHHERMDRIAKSRMIKGPFSLAALGIVVFLTGEVFWGVIGLAVIWGILLVTYDLRIAAVTLREFRVDQGDEMTDKKIMFPNFNISSLARLTWMALPLGVVMTLLSLQTNIPRYFIEDIWGIGELGIFASLAYLVAVGTIIVSAVGESVLPRLAKYYAAGDIAQYNHLLLRMMGIGLFLSLGGVLMTLVAGRPILALLYQPEYADRVHTLVWLMVAGGASYIASFLGYSMTAARYFRVQLPLFVTVTGATYAASLCLIPRLGLTGAAFSLTIGASIQILGSGLVILHALKNRSHRGLP